MKRISTAGSLADLGHSAKRLKTWETFELVGDHKHAYRISYIPPSYTHNTLTEALAVSLHCESPDIRIYSLSTDCDGSSASAPIVIDKHFLGFTPLSAYENDSSHTIDCIAIHGLGGHALGSFQASNSCFVWLRDGIATRFPNIRLWLYGYNSSLTSGDAHGDVQEYAEKFRRLLKTVRKQPDGALCALPLVFLAHSLGGLLLKEAFIQLHQGEEYERAFLRVTYAVLFFGVPGHGMETRALASMVEGNPQRLLLETLNQTVGHRLREKQHDEFCEAFPFVDARIIRLYETRKSPTVERDPVTGLWTSTGEPQLLVLPPSATLGRPCDHKRDTLPLSADHRKMVKFSQGDRVDYPQLEELFSEISQVALPIIQSRLAEPNFGTAVPVSIIAPAAVSEDTRKACLATLSFPTIDSRKHDISAPHPHTADWLLSTPEFKQWLSLEKLQDHNGVLWIKGKPGVGKSTLMKHALTYCKDTFPASYTVAAFFFNARGEALEKTSLGMYRSLVCQIAQQSQPAFERLLSLYIEAQLRQPRDWTWSQGQLQDILYSEVRARQHDIAAQQFFLFVDALDECEAAEIRRTVSFLEQLSLAVNTSRISLHICLSSRHFPEVTMGRHLELTVEGTQQHEEDLASYVTARLHIMIDEIKQELLRKASGVFMWIVLAVEFLNRAYDEGEDDDAMMQELNKMPAELDELYLRHFEAEGLNAVSVLLFQWVLFAALPLTPEQLYLAVQAGINKKGIVPWKSQKINRARILKYLNRHSKGLVEARSSDENGIFTMQFIHKTVDDFLLENKRLHLLDESLASNTVGHSQDRLVDCCFRYVEEVVVGGSITIHPVQTPEWQETTAQYPFLGYVLENIFHHAERAQRQNVSQHQLLKFLHTAQVWDVFTRAYDRYGAPYKAGSLKSQYLHSQTMLYALSFQGCHALVRLMFDSKLSVDIDFQGNYYGTALGAAAANLSQVVVRSLLEEGANPNIQGGTFGTPMQIACSKGHLAIVKLLLDAGVDVNAQGGLYGNALQAACSLPGDTAIVQTLLDAGADVNAKGGLCGNALQTCCFLEFVEVVPLLISAGAEINATGGHFGNALQAACCRGSKSLVEMLLNSGAEVNIKGGRYGTALEAAVSNNYDDIVEVLLKAGAKRSWE